VPMESLWEAAGIAERIGEPELLARAALGLSGPGGTMVPLAADQSWILLERALAGLDDRDSALRAQVMARCAAVRIYFTGDPQATRRLAGAAIDMARRVDDQGALAYVLNTTPFAVWGSDTLGERLALVDELIRLADEIGDSRLGAERHAWKACHYLELGDIAAADRETELQERVAETSRQAYPRQLAAGHRGARAFLEGHFEEAEKHIRAAGELLPPYRLGTGSGFVNLLREQQGRAEELLPDTT